MHLIKAIKKFHKNKSILFTTSGHYSGKNIAPEARQILGKKVFCSDLSEIIGLDNIREPQDIFTKSQQKAAEIYNSKNSFYLYNGSSSGILALMMSVVKPGEKVLIARNAHISVINALVLTGAVPVWVETEWVKEFNICGPVSIEKIKKQLEIHNDIKALWVTNPTYEGIVTDIKPVANLCKQKDIYCIVDEAHGALWNFSSKLPDTAISFGADASVQSLHKNACALNQGAILHIGKNSKLCPEKIQQNLNIVNTTSPSIPLLASVEASINYACGRHGAKKLDQLIDNIERFKKELSQNTDICFLQNNASYKTDPTKIFISLPNISGFEAGEYIFKKYKIEVEIENTIGMLAITGMGTTKAQLDKLKKALIDCSKLPHKKKNLDSTAQIIPEVIFSPRETYYKKHKRIKLADSAGCICAQNIVPYPPGIPLLISGEKIRQEHIKLLNNIEYIDIVD